MSTPRRPRTRRRVALILAVTLAFSGCGSGDGEAVTELPVIGLAETRAIGAPSDLPRVVNLWATWCAPCRRELPEFDAFAAANGDVVEVIGINVGEDEASALGLVRELDLGFTQLLDVDATLSERFAVVLMPSTAFLRSDGSVAFVQAGALDREGLAELTVEHLGVDVDG
ncbi:MAG: TlpA disulfide reductase family protein [Acidimicrobiales bacterium]